MSHTSSRMKRHARAMRRCGTRAEIRTWSWLRRRRFEGFKFRRQVPFGRYILDFYCAELKLAIEVDGAHHDRVEMVDYDSNRSLYLENHGIYVLRIPNALVPRDSAMAEEMIRWAIRRSGSV